MNNYCSLSKADFAFFPVTPAGVSLQAALGHKTEASVYGKAFFMPFISNKIKHYRQSQEVHLGKEPLELIFLSDERYIESLEEDSPTPSQDCLDEYYAEIINIHLKKKGKAWIFGVLPLVEKLSEMFLKESPVYLHEIHVNKDRLWLITIEYHPQNNNIILPDTHLLADKKIFHLS